MSIFHFPRINFKGLMAINVGTANNDDYSGDVFPPDSPYANQPVRLNDSVNVQPAGLDAQTGLVYGMTDEQWVAWAQTPSNFASSPSPKFAQKRSEKAEGLLQAGPDAAPLVPGEWNYYGDMGMTMIGTTVIGITDPNNQIPADLRTALTGGEISFNDETGRSTGMLIDVNPEDPTNSQIFADFLSLKSSQAADFIFSGKPSKAVTRWVNFQRNTMLKGPNGAAATFQFAIPLSALQGQDILRGLPSKSPEGAPLAGIVCRLVFYRSLQKINTFKYSNKTTSDPWFQEITKLYAEKGTNPTYVQIQGTIAPWFEGEPASCPVGRQMLPSANTIPLPPNSISNGPAYGLAPAVAYLNKAANLLSVDFATTFPDTFGGTEYDPMQTDNNPKFDFGKLYLALQNDSAAMAVEGFCPEISYANTAANDGMGWIFDFPVDAKMLPSLETGWLSVISPQYNLLMKESPYLIVSDQSGLYTEQGGPGSTTSSFRSDGAALTPTSFLVYKKGVQLTPADPDRFTLYYFDTTPNQVSGNAILLQNNYVTGSPISFPTDGKGNRLVTATYPGDPYPTASKYGAFTGNLSPIINIRILPNDRDYSQYYLPNTNPPVGNAELSFTVIYNEVLRNYYLLYPAMNKHVALNDPSAWSNPQMARILFDRICLESWGTSKAMPRTRDLSESRRTLLNAWCLKIIQP